MSFVTILTNRTPFPATHCLLPDGEGGELVLVVVKASFVVGSDGEPALAEAPASLRLVDEFRGDPKLGIPRWDSDLAVFKPRVDVLIEAQAHAPLGRPTEQVFVELHVGDPRGDPGEIQLSKSLLVTGDRVWDGDQPSPPLPFLTMPLGWERAYGGTRSREQVDERNPLGIGHQGARSVDPKVRSELPNIENPEAPSTPAGLGVVARAWLPRRTLAGTYDDRWKRRRWPLAPRDFDPAFNQSAPVDQQLQNYVGGESVRLVNLTPEGEWWFRLPKLDLPVHLIYEDRLDRAPLRIDTIEIEAELRRVVLTGRATIAIEPRRGRLEEIVLGHVAPAWLEAKRAGKRHVDLRGHDGADPRRALWS